MYMACIQGSEGILYQYYCARSLLLLLCVSVVDLFPYTVSRCAMSGFHVSNKDSGYVRYGTIANEMNSRNGNG